MTNGEHYVYLLVDASTLQVLYVGKGKNRRSDDHRRLAKRDRYAHLPIYKKIRSLWGAGNDFSVVMVERGLTEGRAFELERELIQTIGLENLMNVTGGATARAASGTPTRPEPRLAARWPASRPRGAGHTTPPSTGGGARTRRTASTPPRSTGSGGRADGPRAH